MAAHEQPTIQTPRTIHVRRIYGTFCRTLLPIFVERPMTVPTAKPVMPMAALSLFVLVFRGLITRVNCFEHRSL